MVFSLSGVVSLRSPRTELTVIIILREAREEKFLGGEVEKARSFDQSQRKGEILILSSVSVVLWSHPRCVWECSHQPGNRLWLGRRGNEV